jgi:hypothetical protein
MVVKTRATLACQCRHKTIRLLFKTGGHEKRPHKGLIYFMLERLGFFLPKSVLLYALA